MRFLLTVICLSLCLHACGGNTSVALDVEWGACDFDRDRWAQADRVGSGCMMSSFLDKHPPEGMTIVELKLWLGEPNFYSDLEDPAYLMAQAGTDGRPVGEQLLVFRVDRRSGRVLDALLRPAS